MHTHAPCLNCKMHRNVCNNYNIRTNSSSQNQRWLLKRAQAWEGVPPPAATDTNCGEEQGNQLMLSTHTTPLLSVYSYISYIKSLFKHFHNWACFLSPAMILFWSTGHYSTWFCHQLLYIYKKKKLDYIIFSCWQEAVCQHYIKWYRITYIVNQFPSTFLDQ